MRKERISRILLIVKNKFLLSTLIFLVWLIVFDQNNLIDRYRTQKQLNKLKKDTLYYFNKIKEDKKSIQLLETDKKSLEKFARERYLMKSKDEDVFVIIKKR